MSMVLKVQCDTMLLSPFHFGNLGGVIKMNQPRIFSVQMIMSEMETI